MEGLGIVGEGREEDVVGLGDGAVEGVLVEAADLEFLEIESLHRFLPLVAGVRTSA
jgi:hypothetical protein